MTPTRRTVLSGGAGVLPALSGCATVLDLTGGSSCGPGETKIEALPTPGLDTRITGEAAHEAGYWVLDDGTGRVTLTVPVEGIEDGACITVIGAAGYAMEDMPTEVMFIPR